MNAEKYIVEFWSMPAQDVSQPGHTPHQVECRALEEAVVLEQKFHAVGWAARAVTLRESRNYPTAR